MELNSKPTQPTAIQRPVVANGQPTQTQQATRPATQPATTQPAGAQQQPTQTVAKPVTQQTAQPQTAARPVVNPQPTTQNTNPVVANGQPTQPTTVQRPVVAQPVAQPKPQEPEIKPTQTNTGAVVDNVDDTTDFIVDETKTFSELNEYDSFKDEEKPFFVNAFTTYLPAALCSIGLIIYMLSGFMILVNAYTIANWITFIAKALTAVALVVEVVRQIKAKKFEFSPSMIIVLLSVFVIM